MKLKECKVCGVEKDLAEYYHERTRECRVCTQIRNYRWRQENYEYVKKLNRERNAKKRRERGRRCRSCEEFKSVEVFAGRGFKCAECRQVEVENELERQRRSTERSMSTSKDERHKRLNESQLRYQKKVKTQVMSAYGGRCACCGESELTFLAIDHRKDNGAQHRREGSVHKGAALYSKLKREDFPEDYQILCFNCNWAKSQGGCPHGNAAGQPGGGLDWD